MMLNKLPLGFRGASTCCFAAIGCIGWIEEPDGGDRCDCGEVRWSDSSERFTSSLLMQAK